MSDVIHWARRGLLLLFLLLPVMTSAADFIPLVPIPGINYGTEEGLNAYLKYIYIIAISIAAFIAVIKITYAGFLYIGSDIITDKSEAKKHLRSAIVGLMIILTAVLILRTINDGVLVLPSLQPLQLQESVGVVNTPYECSEERLLSGTGCIGNNDTIQDLTNECDTYLEEHGYASNPGAGLQRVASGEFRCLTGVVEVPGEDNSELSEFVDIFVRDENIVRSFQRLCDQAEESCEIQFVVTREDSSDELIEYCEDNLEGEMEIQSYSDITSATTQYYVCVTGQ